VKLLRPRRRRRDYVAELAPAREWLVDITVHRGLAERFEQHSDFRGCRPCDDTHTLVTLAVHSTRAAVAQRAARRRGERLGVAVFEAVAR
jgi:hypothetical protein